MRCGTACREEEKDQGAGLSSLAVSSEFKFRPLMNYWQGAET